MTLSQIQQFTKILPETPRFPILFVGHGSPMNGIEDTVYAQKWESLGESLPRPKAVLVVSAHWQTEGTMVHISQKPQTIHDFYGFPKELYEITYDCDGAKEEAQFTCDLLRDIPVKSDATWGIDHGAWVVLLRMYPKADIPVFQLSIDVRASNQEYFDIGRALATLRERGILIMGSGNIVHNLGRISWENNALPLSWASTFDTRMGELLLAKNFPAIIKTETLGEEAKLSIPTREHYSPLLYVLGASTEEENVSFPVWGIVHGSISMRAVQIGK